MLEQYPQHYAMTLLGMATGLRPSSMRPIRRGGKTRMSSGARGSFTFGGRTRSATKS